MGQELDCRIRFQKRWLTGRALLETDHLLFRGEERLKVPFRELSGVRAEGGVLKLEFPERAGRVRTGRRRGEVGAQDPASPITAGQTGSQGRPGGPCGGRVRGSVSGGTAAARCAGRGQGEAGPGLLRRGEACRLAEIARTGRRIETGRRFVGNLSQGSHGHPRDRSDRFRTRRGIEGRQGLRLFDYPYRVEVRDSPWQRV